MKSPLKIGQAVGILTLLLLFVVGSVSFRHSTDSVKKQVATHKKADSPSQTSIKKADEAVVPVFNVKLYQQVFSIIERHFYILSTEKPRHPNTYPIFRSAFFANIFSKAIAINAP